MSDNDGNESDYTSVSEDADTGVGADEDAGEVKGAGVGTGADAAPICRAQHHPMPGSPVAVELEKFRSQVTGGELDSVKTAVRRGAHWFM